MKLGQARGAAVVAGVERALPVFEFTATQIKQSIVGRGHADKGQVQHMVKILLCLRETPPVDAADALAVALCHGHMSTGFAKVASGVTSRRRETLPMIGRLRGVLMEKKPPYLLVDVGGVGYEVEAPMTTFYRLPEVEQNISIFTHLVVRDDAHLLFGFWTDQERRMFRTLLKVNGVGAKMALAILSGMGCRPTGRVCRDRRHR